MTLACFSSGVAVARPTDEQVEFFEKRVRPVLVERCYECHQAEKKTKGGLALDHREGLLKGGDTGPALVAGEPDKSLLIEAVRYANHDLQMPPKKRLSDGEVKVLEDWVRMGAPDPRESGTPARAARTIDIAAGRRFWSFAPLLRVEPPEGDCAASPIDGFLRAKLTEKALKPAPPADRRTLIRRATFDVIGLPPTPAEVDAFVADTEPGAFARVVERLLASPQYGERWGRHWLDVARYADSNGMDENIAFGNAWRYRDYVVRAFNEDKPFDQFLIEQIAGDLLPRSEEAMTGTGFLALGARVLAEPDLQKLEMDIIDEQIDTVGKAFLGMTLGCVRCHDHKFDPVTQEDYYALAAIFRSTRSLAAEKKGAIKFWFEHSLATPQQLEEKTKFEAELKEKKAKVTVFTASARNVVKAGVQSRAVDYLAAASVLSLGAQAKEVQWVAKGRGLDGEFLRRCRGYLDAHPEHPVFRVWRECAQRGDSEGVRAHYTQVFSEALVVKKGPAYDALMDAKGFLALPAKDAEVLDAKTLAEAAAMNKEVAAFELKQPELPALMGVEDGAVLKTLPVHIRGSYLALGKPVERGFPEVMRPVDSRPILPAKRSGRLELARWLAGSEHPLTARVLVNRVWRWHFGQGIVASTDNFGLLGGTPSHPELLDWLARTFIESGWSIKDLHRVIMASAAYQQASAPVPSTAGAPDPRLVDPENRLLWRANIQRLEAEQIRDAMLFVSGWLDLTAGGKTIPLRNREFVFNHTSKDATTYESARRALYLPIIRNHLYDMLEGFDYPDPTMPTGSRNSTVVAPQALIMMNAPVVLESAKRLAKRLGWVVDERARVQEVYRMLYGRPATAREVADTLALVRDLSAEEGDERGWVLAAQALFAANEFIYLR